MALFKDYYSILSIDPHASSGVVKAAYRALSSQHHPDKVGGNESFMKDVNEAYSCLINEDARRHYDEVYFLRKEAPPRDSSNNLPERWLKAARLYPNIEIYFVKLKNYSENLASAYKVHILEDKLFEDAGREFFSFERKFLFEKFGNQNSDFFQFSRHLYAESQWESIRQLSEYTDILGSNIHGHKVTEIVSLISPKYFETVVVKPPANENLGPRYFINVVGTFLIALLAGSYFWWTQVKDPLTPALESSTYQTGISAKMEPIKVESNTSLPPRALPAVLDDDAPLKTESLTSPSAKVLSNEAIARSYVEFPIFDASKFQSCENSESSNAGIQGCQDDLIKRYEEQLNDAAQFFQKESGAKINYNQFVKSFHRLTKSWCFSFESLAWGPGQGSMHAIAICRNNALSWFGSLVNGTIFSKIKNEKITCEKLPVQCSEASSVQNNLRANAFNIEKFLEANIGNIYPILFEGNERLMSSQEYSKDLLSSFKESSNILLGIDNLICGGSVLSLTEDEKLICQFAVWNKFVDSMSFQQTQFQKLIDENRRKN